MNPSKKTLYAYIAAAVCRYFGNVKIPCTKVIKMFWEFAEMRSNFNLAYSDEQGRSGIFALSQNIFSEMKRRLNFDKNVSPFDPIANIEAAIAYLAWLFEKYEKFASDENERLKIALLAFDEGYFKVKFALEKCRKPVVLEQVAVVANCYETGKYVFNSIKCSNYCLRNFREILLC